MCDRRLRTGAAAQKRKFLKQEEFLKMKKHSVRLLALLLAVVMLVSLVLPYIGL